MLAPTEQLIVAVADELEMSEEVVVRDSLRALLERNLRQIEAQLFEIHGRYGVKSIAELDALYQAGNVEEADSWRDYQSLDHLEYKRSRLVHLLETLG